MPPYMMAASYGGVAFWVSSLSGRAGRDITVKSPSRGDAHVLQDRGLRHGTTQMELLFVDEPDKPSPEERFLEFKRLANDIEPQIFRHPLDGSYRARVTDFDYQIRSDTREIGASCTFLPDGDPITVVALGLGAAPLAGAEEVSATVDTCEVMLAEQRASSDVPRNVLEKVTAWTQAETPDTRAVYLEAASLSQQIGAEVNRLELLTAVDRWPLYREFVGLNFQMRRAAEAVTSETAHVFDVLVSSAQPLRALCARLYGAPLAEDKARQISQLNGLRSPGLVPAGTTLKVPREGMR